MDTVCRAYLFSPNLFAESLTLPSKPSVLFPKFDRSERVSLRRKSINTDYLFNFRSVLFATVADIFTHTHSLLLTEMRQLESNPSYISSHFRICAPSLNTNAPDPSYRLAVPPFSPGPHSSKMKRGMNFY